MSSNFLNKILNAEVPPPPSVWNSIAAELDKLDHPQFVDKIAAASIDPPASAWENVASALDKAAGPKVVRLNKQWVKWAAAAVVVALIAYSSTIFLRSDAEENSVTASIPKKENDATTSANAMKGIPSRADDIHPSIAFIDNRRSVRTAQNLSTDNVQNESLVRHASIETAEAEKTTTNNSQGEPKISDNISSKSSHVIPPPDYFVVTAPNGERVRISSKFSDAVTSLYGGDNVDYLWKSRFDSWKSKLMTNPSFIPAAGNFLDIVELKDLLKEQ